MPHVVVEGDVDLAAWVHSFRPLLVRRGGDVLRADAAYLEQNGRTALVEALAIEAGRKLPFYVKISRHDRGTEGVSTRISTRISTTVRIDPLTHPERSDGVREIVARVGLDLLQRSPDARLGVTNLVISSYTEPPEESPGGDAE